MLAQRLRSGFFLTLVLIYCKTEIHCQTQKNEVQNLLADTAGKPNYFPAETLIDNEFKVGFNDFKQHWYSKFLEAFEEPVLFHTDQTGVVFRFLWQRTNSSLEKPVTR